MTEYAMRPRPAFMPFVMIAVLFGLIAVCFYLLLPFAQYTVVCFFGIKDGAAFVTDQAAQLASPPATLYMQVLLSSVGFFLLPAILFHIIFRADMAGTLQLQRLAPTRQWLLAIFVMLAAALFIQVLVQISTAIPLPDQWKWLRTNQANGEKMIDTFFSDPTTGRFWLLAICLALLPAVGEEVFFRGTIQNLLMKTYIGPIWAVIFTGGLFSMLHMEFNNFLAIWCMGIVLGLLYYYTGSIWVSISAHFVNNMLVVGGKYAYLRGMVNADIANSDSLPIYISLPAGVLMVWGIITLRRWHETMSTE